MQTETDGTGNHGGDVPCGTTSGLSAIDVVKMAAESTVVCGVTRETCSTNVLSAHELAGAQMVAGWAGRYSLSQQSRDVLR